MLASSAVARRSATSAPVPKLIRKTISCGAKQDKATILAEIELVSDRPTVNDLVVEDLLSNSARHALIPKVDALIFAPGRDWLKIQFRDSFGVDSYPVWRKQKGRMIVGYEENGTNEPESGLRGVLRWSAIITVPENTTVETLMDLLGDIKDDPYVLDMQLNGGKPSPSGLARKIDWEAAPGETEQHNALMEAITIDLDCGWGSEEAKAATNFKKFINVCLCRFEEGRRETRKQIQRANSMSASGRSKSPRRRTSGRALPGIKRTNTGGSINKSLQTMSSSSRSRSRGRNGAARDLADGSSKSPTHSRSPMRPSNGRGIQRVATDGTVQKRSKSSGSKSLMRRAVSVGDEHESSAESQRKPCETSRTSPSPSTVVSDQVDKPPHDDGKYWRSAEDPATGKTYYFHKKTKETLWDKPAQMAEYEQKIKTTAAKAG